MLLRNGLCALAGFTLLAAAPMAPLDWAFPGAGPNLAEVSNDRLERLRGSSRTFTEAALKDRTHAPDWFPSEHPPAPRSVIAGTSGAYACGYCHW